MANRSTFNSVLPRGMKRLVDLSNRLPNYNKVEIVEILKDGDKVKRRVINKDYDNMLRDLFIEAHSTHRRFKQTMLTKKTNEAEESEGIVEI